MEAPRSLGTRTSVMRWSCPQHTRVGTSASALQKAIKTGDAGGIAEAALRLGATVDNVRQGYYEQGGAAGQVGATLLRAADGVDMAEKAVGLARKGDYAGAAGEALRLVDQLRGDNKYGQAAAVADKAGTLVGAIRTGDPAKIADAAAQLGTAVDAARKGYDQPGVQQARFAQTLNRVAGLVKMAESAVQAVAFTGQLVHQEAVANDVLGRIGAVGVDEIEVGVVGDSES